MIMRTSIGAVVVFCVVAGAGCGTTTSLEARGGGRAAVPDLRGASLRDATCTLRDMDLRWRLRGTRDTQTRPRSGCGSDGIRSSGDDDRVTGQSPPTGTRVRRGTVVVLDTWCTELARTSGRGCID
jgi:hypothetical protein